MSLATWKKKYYPVEASEAVGSDLEAAEHSLQKWTGAKLAELKTHELSQVRCVIWDNQHHGISFVADTCALCWRAGGPDNPVCSSCIGMRANNRKCFSTGGNDSAPYNAFFLTGRIAPMLAWLRKAVALAKKEAKAR